jgi:hypothetical protein
MAIKPRSPVAMTQSSGLTCQLGQPEEGQLRVVKPFPLRSCYAGLSGRGSPASRPSPATAPGPLTPGPDAASALPGARMGALADLSAYQ